HLPPLVLRHLRSEQLSDGGPAIGLFPTAHFEQSSVTLRAGDIVALFTDGITEATNASGYEFGEQRLARALQCNTARRPEDLVEHVFDRCLHFTSGTTQQDDMTLLILRSA